MIILIPYVSATSKPLLRKEKSAIIDEVVRVLDYHRKYAIQVLNGPVPATKRPSEPAPSVS